MATAATRTLVCRSRPTPEVVDDAAVDLWDREARTFDDEVDHGLTSYAARTAWRALMLSALPPAPAHIADLGCGTATLTALLAELGYTIDGIDFSPAMVERARAKTAALPNVTVALGDAAEPQLPAGTYDAVLSRHVLWAMPDPAGALRRWCELLSDTGTLVLVEGNWSTGAGLTASKTVDLVGRLRDHVEVQHLEDPALWGRRIDDERYLVLSRASTTIAG